ncbi:MAG: DNA repair protein RecO, partial [Omnitrophica bacterium RBG_13_46_9]
MSIQKTRGFVLRREDVRETSVLLTVYTRDFGKLKLISKGARSPDQRFASSYELFALDDIVFYERKKKGFFLLSQCELVSFFPEVSGSLDRICYATYFIELLDFVTQPGEKNPELYDLLLDSLEFLCSNASPKRVARIFEIKMLSILGLMPRLRSCVNCDKELGGREARFSFSSGGVLCEACFGADRTARPVLAGTIKFISHIEEAPFDRIKQIKVSQRV